MRTEEQKNRYNAQSRIYRKQNREKLRIANRIYREKNRAKCRGYQKKYRDKNKEKVKQSKKPWLARITSRDGKKCKKCGSLEKLTLQHKIPKCIGGKDTYENLEILCLKCNMEDYKNLVKKALIFYFKHHDE